MTPFERAKQDYFAGILRVPNVSMGNKQINYFGYQLSVHHFNLKLMASGMKFRGITFTQIKKYYGLTGKGAKDVLPQFKEIMDEYLAEITGL